MFRNRAFQVDFVKKENTPAGSEKKMNFEDKLVMVSVTAERIIKKIAIAACVLVILDTGRKVAVEKSKRP